MYILWPAHAILVNHNIIYSEGSEGYGTPPSSPRNLEAVLRWLGQQKATDGIVGERAGAQQLEQRDSDGWLEGWRLWAGGVSDWGADEVTGREDGGAVPVFYKLVLVYVP